MWVHPLPALLVKYIWKAVKRSQSLILGPYSVFFGIEIHVSRFMQCAARPLTYVPSKRISQYILAEVTFSPFAQMQVTGHHLVSRT